MNIPRLAVEKQTVTYFGLGLMTLAGLAAYTGLGQLEDPAFTVKTAVVVTTYPGAGPDEVELEVTDIIEQAIQEMDELDYVRSVSRSGLSMIKVYIEQKYWYDVLPQIWDKLRKKVSDIHGQLPPGAGTPQVIDDFSAVYGFVLAATGDGFDLLELYDYSKVLKKELSLVEGVARCELWGSPQKVVYIDISQKQASQLGITPETIIATLQQQNLVVDAGSIDFQNRRLRVQPAGEFQRPEDIGDLTLRVTKIDALDRPQGVARSTDLIRIRDLGEVYTDYYQPEIWSMRHNGREPAIGLQISPLSGENVVQVGRNIEKRIHELLGEFPVGIEVDKVAWQADLVDMSIKGFMINLIEAVLIVMVVLWLSMGFRMACIIGVGGLVLTIVGTFMVMGVWGIDLQRMSLGALIIAMGMMVDNAIVVADGIVIKMQQGLDRRQAAIEAASAPAIPLLGATVIATMAFYPIYAAPSDVGEYCRSLFQVVGSSLLLSWLLGITIVPLMCMALLPTPETGGAAKDPYDTRFYHGFRKLLEFGIRFKVPVMLLMIGLLGVATYGFRFVNQMFFPDSSRPQLMVDYWAPQGTRVQQVKEDTRAIEGYILEDDRVTSVTTFIGQGPPRFYLPVEPEMPYPEYAQFVISFDDYKQAFAFADDLEPWLGANVPEALTRVRKFGVGPSDTWKFEVLISGPADASLATLRALGDQGMDILRGCPLAREVRTNMRQRSTKIVVDYDQAKGRWALIDRRDIGMATRVSFDGLPVGLYREGDDLYPIITRYTAEERRVAAAALESLPVTPMVSSNSVPLLQVTNGIRLEWEDPIIRRWDRRRSIRVQCSPIDGVTFPQLQAEVIDQFNAMELPSGYTMKWRGEADSTATAQVSLIPGLIPTIVIMAFTIVALFNAFRPPAVIVCTIPFAMIGVTLGFVITREAFGFLALLGLMSLSGMMIKNAIVLLDEANAQIASGKSRTEAIIQAAMSRLRPVVNAAATTVLGVVPLLQDPFWVGMAVTIMFGLAFGTVLTMLVIPVLYACFYRLKV